MMGADWSLSEAGGWGEGGREGDAASEYRVLLSHSHSILSLDPSKTPPASPCHSTCEGATEKGKSLSSPGCAPSHFCSFSGEAWEAWDKKHGASWWCPRARPRHSDPHRCTGQPALVVQKLGEVCF